MKSSLILRIFGFFFVVAAVFGLILSIFAISKVWQYKELIYQNLSSSIELAEDTLDATANALTVIDEGLATMSTNITILENTIKATSRAFGDTTPIADSLIPLVDEDLPKTILSAQTSLNSAQTSAELIENALTTITSIPFVPGDPYDPPVPLHEALGLVSESLEPIDDSMTEIKDSLNTTRGNIILIQAELNIMARHINELNKSLYSAQSVVAQYQKIVSNLHERLGILETKLPNWLYSSALVMTIFLIWLGILQLGLFIQGIDLITRSGLDGSQ